MPSLRAARWPMRVDRASSVLTGSSRTRAKHWAALRKLANASAPRLVRTADLLIPSCRRTSPSVTSSRSARRLPAGRRRGQAGAALARSPPSSPIESASESPTERRAFSPPGWPRSTVRSSFTRPCSFRRPSACRSTPLPSGASAAAGEVRPVNAERTVRPVPRNLAGRDEEANARFGGLVFMTQPPIGLCTATCAELPRRWREPPMNGARHAALRIPRAGRPSSPTPRCRAGY